MSLMVIMETKHIKRNLQHCFPFVLVSHYAFIQSSTQQRFSNKSVLPQGALELVPRGTWRDFAL